MTEIDESGVHADGFAARFGELLIEARRKTNSSCRAFAKRSGGRFDVAALHEAERGAAALTEDLVLELGELYGVSVDEILPGRASVHIGAGVMSVGDVASPFTVGDASSMLTTYLRLVRGLRRQQRAPFVELRRDDVEQLAAEMGRPGEWVVEQLAVLMGTTRAQHRSMVGLFAGGATVIAVVASLALTGSAGAGPAAAGGAPSVAVRMVASHLDLPPELALTDVPVIAPPAVPTGVDDTGALVATDLGTGDDPSPPAGPTGIDDGGALVATDLGTGDDPTATAIHTGIDAHGALVATDVGTGDASTITTISAAIDDHGALVATDVGTGDDPTSPG